MMTDCQGPDCKRPAKAKGLCGSHYEQQRRGAELTPLRAYGEGLSDERRHNGYYAAKRTAGNHAKRERVIFELGGACFECGEVLPFEAYDIHHRDASEKTLAFAASWHRPIEVLLKEAASCDLLCPTCHRLRHLREDGQYGGRPDSNKREVV